MAIKYTSRIPQQTADTGTSFDQAPAFPRLMDRRDWNDQSDPYGLNRYQYVTPADFQRWASQQKQEGGDSQDTANVQRGQAATALANSYNITAGKQPAAQSEAPKSELDQERERLRNKFSAPLHDDSNAWVQSANRGRAAIDNGQELKPTPMAGSYEFATRTLPSGTPNAPLTYTNTGDTINDRGVQLMKDAGWTDEQIANRDSTGVNWGFHKYLSDNGGIDHTQAEYEEYEREKRRKQMEYEMAMRQNYGPSGGQTAMSLGVPDDSGSTGGFDMTGPSVADFYQLDGQGYNDAPSDYSQTESRPAYYKAHDEFMRALSPWFNQSPSSETVERIKNWQ